MRLQGQNLYAGSLHEKSHLKMAKDMKIDLGGVLTSTAG